MFQKNNIIWKVCSNAYVCILNIQYVNKVPAGLQYYFMWASYRMVEQKKLYKNVEA